MPYSETIERLTREAVIALNIKWDSEGWTNAAIKQEMDDNNESSSLSTIQRIRSDKNGEKSYNYNNTIKPHMRVFFNNADKPIAVSETNSAAELEIAALKNTIMMKETDIAVLTAKLEAAEGKITDSNAKIDYLKKQVTFKETQMTTKDSLLSERRDFIYRLEDEKRSQRRVITVLSIIVAALLLIIFTALIIDRANSGIGFFWLDGVSRFFNGKTPAATEPAVNAALNFLRGAV